MNNSTPCRPMPVALALLASERPRNVDWKQAAGLLFGDWGTSRLYVLGLAYFFARGISLYLILAMSALILGVAWAYTQICRIYPDGGGVYTAARHRSRTLAVIGALLLFADYVVTASLSALDAFHYFGLHDDGALFSLHSPGLLAMVAIVTIGLFNLLGPRHTSGFAVVTAVGMVFVTLLITLGALPQIHWSQLQERIGTIDEPPHLLWTHFVAIVLALSGVEAIGNLTGVMQQPVARTARKAIWVVAIEVAAFNILLALCMVARLTPDQHDAHKEDMLAFLSLSYVGRWAEIAVRVVGGLLLLSAANTVVTDMISVQYLMSRDGELPSAFQKLNRFGVPIVPALIALSVPCLVLVVSHDLEHLAALYAIGVVGAVAINVTLCSIHPRLRRAWRKIPMLLLGALLGAIWITLALTKLHALVFVCVVLITGLLARQMTRWWSARNGKPSLLRQAIAEQFPEHAFIGRKVLIGTYGSLELADSALLEAKRRAAALVVCFIREVTLSYKYEADRKISLDTDLAAVRTFSRFLTLAHDAGVPIIPVYDGGADAAELLAEHAALNSVDVVLIGSSRRGTLHHMIKGSFQRRLEGLLPPEIKVEVLRPHEPLPTLTEAPMRLTTHRRP